MNTDLIIKRIKDGGPSGAYLAAAVRSHYTGHDFDQSLNYFLSMD